MSLHTFSLNIFIIFYFYYIISMVVNTMENVLNPELIQVIKKYSVLTTSKIQIKQDGTRVSANSEEELRQVEEILRDAKFFKIALVALKPDRLYSWLVYADKSIYNDKDLIKIIAEKAPIALSNVPLEKLNDIELIREIASNPDIDYYNVTDYIPSNLIDEFTKVWEQRNNMQVDKYEIKEIVERRTTAEDIQSMSRKLEILKNAKIRTTLNGLISDNSPEELRQVQEILKDAKFFKTALERTNGINIMSWLTIADKSIFNDQDLLLTIAKNVPVALNNVPLEIMDNIELIRNMASISNINYESVIDYIPSHLMSLFTSVYETKNQTTINKRDFDKTLNNRIRWEERQYADECVEILEKADIRLNEDGTMYSTRSEEELRQVQEILKDAKFFKTAFKQLNPIRIGSWLYRADKSIFKDNDLLKIIAEKAPTYMNAVPMEYKDNKELMMEIASLPNLKYDSIIDYLPVDIMEEFTTVYENTHDVQISRNHLEEIKINAQKVRDYQYATKKWEILRNSKIALTPNGMISKNSEEELRQVQEILRDVDFFKKALKSIPDSGVVSWLYHVDKSMFNDKELILLLAKALPHHLSVVPYEILENEDLLFEIAGTPGMKWRAIIDRVPSNLMEEFTRIWSETNGEEINEEFLEELKGYRIAWEENNDRKPRQK